MKRRARLLRRQEDTELNITPFMNLMVVLVPFLLLMAVFTQLTVVQLALPGDQIEKKEKEPPIQLEVVLRKNRIDVQDRGSDLLGQYDIQDGKDNFVALQKKLVEIKIKFPEVTAISVLAEDDVDYGRIIATMDIIRTRVVAAADGVLVEELFPDIALGKANIELMQESTETVQ